METPLISIIIINYNGKQFLQNCIDSIYAGSYKNFEIILVDNNSSDDSLTLIHVNYPEVHVISLEKNYGFAYPCNVGAKNANGEFLMFLNNDTFVSKNWLEPLIETMNLDSDIAICQSLLLKEDNSVDSAGDFIDEFGRAFSSKKIPTSASLILSGKGAAILVRKKIFWNIGGFNELFFVSFEDVDLGWRSWIYGYKVMVVPESIVYHLGGSTIKKMKDDVVFHGVKNTLLLRLFNFEFSLVLKSISILFFVSISRKIFRIKLIEDPEEVGPLPSFTIIFKGSFWILKNFFTIIKYRRQINSKRVITTKQLRKMNLVKNH